MRIRSSNRANRWRRGRNEPITRTSSLTKLVVGSIITIPFVIDVFVLRHGYHQMPLSAILMLMGFVIGTPMALIGLAQLTSSGVGIQSMMGLDVIRIRIATEKEAMKK